MYTEARAMDPAENPGKDWRELENGAENRGNEKKKMLARWGWWEASVTNLELVTVI